MRDRKFKYGSTPQSKNVNYNPKFKDSFSKFHLLLFLFYLKGIRFKLKIPIMLK